MLLLDVTPPGTESLQMCPALRSEGDRTPILLLTALVGTADRITGPDAGADDYAVEPFDVQDVFAGLRAGYAERVAPSTGRTMAPAEPMRAGRLTAPSAHDEGGARKPRPLPPKQAQGHTRQYG